MSVAALVMTQEDLDAALARALEPVRQELARLRQERAEEGVSIEEAARRLRLSQRTIRRRIAAGDLQAVRVGGVQRVLLSGVLTSDPSSR